MEGCPYCFGSGKVVVWEEVDRDEETVTVQSRLETCSECNGSGFGKIETEEIYTESDVENAFDDGYRAALKDNEFQYETGFVKGFEAAQPKWISVEERLPEPDKDVLTLYYGKYHCIGYYSEDCKLWIINDAPVYDEGVDHWMPLPEAPKEEV